MNSVLFEFRDILTSWQLALCIVIYNITLRTAAPDIAGLNLEFRFQDMFQVGRTVKIAEAGGSTNLPSSWGAKCSVAVAVFCPNLGTKFKS